jgi:hypothetical protein
MKQLCTPQTTEFTEKCRRNWEEHVRRINTDRVPQDFKASSEREKKFRKTSETIKRLCHITYITCLKSPNTGKDGGDDDIHYIKSLI